MAHTRQQIDGIVEDVQILTVGEPKWLDTDGCAPRNWHGR